MKSSILFILYILLLVLAAHISKPQIEVEAQDEREVVTVSSYRPTIQKKEEIVKN